jgi:hypothetical protein
VAVVRSAEPATAGAPRQSRRTRRTVACLVLLGLLAYGLVDDVLTQVRLHHTQVRLARTTGALTSTARQLAAVEPTLAVANATKVANQTMLNQLSGELATAEQHLAQAKQGLELQNLDITTLNTCVSGVQ